MILNKSSESLIETWHNKTNYQRFNLICPSCGETNNIENNEFIQGLFNVDLILSDQLAVIEHTCYYCKNTEDFALSKINISQENVMKLFLQNKDFVLLKLFDDEKFQQELNELYFQRLTTSSKEMSESVELMIESYNKDEYENFNNKSKEELVLLGMTIYKLFIKKVLNV